MVCQPETSNHLIFDLTTILRTVSNCVILQAYFKLMPSLRLNAFIRPIFDLKASLRTEVILCYAPSLCRTDCLRLTRFWHIFVFAHAVTELFLHFNPIMTWIVSPLLSESTSVPEPDMTLTNSHQTAVTKNNVFCYRYSEQKAHFSTRKWLDCAFSDFGCFILYFRHIFFLRTLLSVYIAGFHA